MDLAGCSRAQNSRVQPARGRCGSFEHHLASYRTAFRASSLQIRLTGRRQSPLESLGFRFGNSRSRTSSRCRSRHCPRGPPPPETQICAKGIHVTLAVLRLVRERGTAALHKVGKTCRFQIGFPSGSSAMPSVIPQVPSSWHSTMPRQNYWVLRNIKLPISAWTAAVTEIICSVRFATAAISESDCARIQTTRETDHCPISRAGRRWRHPGSRAPDGGCSRRDRFPPGMVRGVHQS